MTKVYTSIYNLKAGDWIKVLSLSPEDIREANKSAYVGRLFKYYGDGFFQPIDELFAALIRFKTGMTYTQENL